MSSPSFSPSPTQSKTLPDCIWSEGPPCVVLGVWVLNAPAFSAIFVFMRIYALNMLSFCFDLWSDTETAGPEAGYGMSAHCSHNQFQNVARSSLRK